ncbi:MAG TPA: OmpA family protein [Gemmatimonadaceae bacterium]|jgi:peptidoglycan-associated lipoprotein|nr:OmpA family protein [Gemmatimonadaceae bacterium]
MRTSPRRGILPLFAALVTAATAACHHAPAPAPPTPAQAAVNQDSIARANARRDSIARAEAARRAAAREDSIRAAAQARAAALAAAQAALVQAIHFDFDRADILAPDRAVLDRKAGVLAANRPIRLRIEGNTDERGSDEYNLALGMRRAAAAKQYLVARGVDSSSVTTVSNGEERPVCQQHDEDCWSKNRRDEFSVVGGGNVVVVPDR